jgi:hypothetical protein
MLYLGRQRISARTNHIYRPMWFKHSTRTLRIIMLPICEFRENGSGEGRTFLMGPNEIALTRVP